MDTSESLKKLWEENKRFEKPADRMDIESVKKVVASRLKRERNTIARYFWATLTYHIVIYSFMCYLFIRHLGDIVAMALSLAGTILFLPITIMLFRRIKVIFRPGEKPGTPQAIYAHVEHQYNLLESFFRFKKIFDWIVIPVSNLLVIAIFLQLYTDEGIAGHWRAAVVPYLLMVASLVAAIWYENRDQFIIPLRHLRGILDDIRQPQEAGKAMG